MPEQFPPEAAQFLKNLEIVCTGDADWLPRLLGVIAKPDPAGPPSRALSRVFEIAATDLKCKSVLVEPYVSTDFSDEYAAYYSRVFRHCSKVCKRLHFFRGLGPDGRSLEIIDLLNWTDAVQESYCGYCVVRPTKPLMVGDTVLLSPAQHNGFELVHCQCTFDVHILGRTLTIRGMPFIEQDSAVSVCADSDLWMLARYMHRIGECRRYRPSEMRELATKGIFLGRVRDGLVMEQMTDALRQMGLSPELFYANDPEQTVALLYSCVESQLPVIVGVPGHVVTVIGHGYKDKMEFGDDQATMACCVDEFVAHDDATSPYRRMEIGATSINGRNRLTLGGQLVDWCIFPEPPRVNLRRSDIVAHLRQWLAELHKLKALDSDGQPVQWFTQNELKGLVTREYLRRSDKFKQDINPPDDDHRRKSSGYDPRPIELILRYWRLHMPKYVWVVELARRDDLAGHAPLGRKIVGEVIFDATGYHQDVLGSLLAFHLNHRLIIRKSPVENDDFEIVTLSLHNAYSPLLRSAARTTAPPLS